MLRSPLPLVLALVLSSGTPAFAAPTVAQVPAPGRALAWVLEKTTVTDQRVRKDEEWYFAHRFTLDAAGGSGEQSWKDGTYKHAGSSACKASWSLPPSLTPAAKATVPVKMSIEARQTGGFRTLSHWTSFKVNGGLVAEVKCQGPSNALPGPVGQDVTFDVPAGQKGATLTVRVSYQAVGGAGAVDYFYRLLEVYVGAPVAPASAPAVPASRGWVLESSSVTDQRVKKDEEYYFAHRFTLDATGGSGEQGWKDGTYKHSGSSLCRASWSLPLSLEPKAKATVPVKMAIEAMQTGGYRNLTHWLSFKVNGMLAAEVKCQGPSNALPGPLAQDVAFDVPPGSKGATLTVRVFYQAVGGAGSVDFLYRFKE